MGIGNNEPRGLMDVNDNPTGNASHGLVLPISDNVTTMTNPTTGNVTNIVGTVAYDSDQECISLYKGGSWDCL